MTENDDTNDNININDAQLFKHKFVFKITYFQIKDCQKTN